MVDALAAGVRKAAGGPNSGVHKGPKDAVIRQADEGEDGFEEAGGQGEDNIIVVSRPGEGRVGGPGGRGSVQGVRVGTKEASGGASGDTRLAQIKAEKAARKAAALPATQKPAAPATPVAAAGQAEIEDWEQTAGAGASDPAAKARAAEAATLAVGAKFEPTNDLLARSAQSALTLLAQIPDGMELFVGGNGLNAKGIEVVMGLGYLVGKKLAAYRGDSHYRITSAGVAAYIEGKV